VILAPRVSWGGAGAGAAPGSAAICPHCHVQNEQLWTESGGRGGGRGGGGGGGGVGGGEGGGGGGGGISTGLASAAATRDVHHTQNVHDRVMAILAPPRRGEGAIPARPRRRAGKNGGASGYNIPGGGGGGGGANAGAYGSTEAPSDGGGAMGLSRSAPAASGGDGISLMRRAMGGGGQGLTLVHFSAQRKRFCGVRGT
jgi:hypothetical protein